MIKEETDVLEDVCRSRLGRLAVEQEGPHKRHLWHEAWPSESAVSVVGAGGRAKGGMDSPPGLMGASLTSTSPRSAVPLFLITHKALGRNLLCTLVILSITIY